MENLMDFYQRFATEDAYINYHRKHNGMANPSAHTAAVLLCISASPAVEEVMFATTTKRALLAARKQEDGNVWKVVDKDNPNPDPEDEKVVEWREYRNFFSLVKGRSTS